MPTAAVRFDCEASMSLPTPAEFHALVVRTDFSDDAAWARVCTAVESADCEGYTPKLVRVDDRAYEGMTSEDLRSHVGPDTYYLFVVDARTVGDPEQSVLVVDVDPESEQPGRVFRTVPREVCAIDANLGISNMDFEEFADSVGADGVFRGFQ
jgi:hypothetical protein